MDNIPIENSTTQKRRLPRWLRRTLWGVAWVVTLLALVVVIENWLGAREWRAYQEEARAAGESLELAAVVPPPAKDEDNFAAIPLFKPLFDYDRAAPGSNEFIGQATWRDSAAKERLEQLKPFGEAKLKGMGNWRKGKGVDLAALQQALSKEFPTELSELTTPGGDVLRVLARLDADVAALRAAAPRPRSRFPIRYEEHISVPLPHIGVLMAFCRVAAVRAVAQLSLGNAEPASGDVVLALRIAEGTIEEPLLISQLVTAAQLEIAIQPLWEGLHRRQWNEEQLASFEAALARFDLLTGFQRGLRGERSILGVQALDAFKKQPQLLFTVFDFSSGRGAPFWAQVCAVAMPSGWVDFNKAHICRYYDRQIPTVKPAEHRILREVAETQEKAHEEALKALWINPRKIVAAMAMPQLTHLQLRCGAAQVTADLARVAVAIERYRLKHGTVPAQLEGLAPKFLAKVPPDVMTGEALRYRVAADWSFELYSVGWNVRDDGGEYGVLADSKSGEIDWRSGDWPWPQEDLTGAE